jgi:uncharacterized membrane protein
MGVACGYPTNLTVSERGISHLSVNNVEYTDVPYEIRVQQAMMRLS